MSVRAEVAETGRVQTVISRPSDATVTAASINNNCSSSSHPRPSDLKSPIPTDRGAKSSSNFKMITPPPPQTIAVPNDDDQNHKRLSTSKTADDMEDRETWDKKTEFLLAVIGFAVDLGNVSTMHF